MNRLAILPVLTALAGCFGPVPPTPEPVTAVVAVSPADAIQRAGRFAVGQGFDVLLSDAPAGILRAQQTYEGKIHPFFACRFTESETRNLKLQVQLTFSVSARAQGDSSVVLVSPKVLSRVPSLSQVYDASDCAPTVALGDAIIAAMR